MFHRWVVVTFSLATAWIWACAHLATAKEPRNESGEPKAEISIDFDEAIMKHFKTPTDTASLLAYLKSRTVSDEDLSAIPQRIARLGCDKHAERRDAINQLVATGLPAFMPLHDSLDDRDPERARLAKLAIERMDRGTRTVAVPAIAINMLIKRKPPELLDALVRYLPSTTDPEVEANIYYAVDELARLDGKAHDYLVNALHDALPARRALAGCIVSRTGTDEQRLVAQKLLEDRDANVRLRTAQGFLSKLNKIAIPALIDLLDARPIAISWQAEELLKWAADGAAPKRLVWGGGDRARKAKAAWQKWWAEAEDKIDLRHAAKQPSKPRLYSTRQDAAFVGCDMRIRWGPWQVEEEIGLRSVTCMPDGRLFGIVFDSDAPFEETDHRRHYRFCEATLEHKVLRETAWRSNHGGFCEIGPNGIATIIPDREKHVLSIGLEGTIVKELECDGIPSFPNGRAARGLYNGLIITVNVNPRDFDSCPLVDPLSGEIVCLLPYPGRSSSQFYCLNSQILMRDNEALFLVESGKLPKFLQDMRREQGEAIGLLRPNQIFRYNPRDHELAQYSCVPKWQTIFKAKAGHDAPWDGVLRFPFLLVSFGFD